MWRNKEGNKNKGHEQDGKINQRMQRVILPTEKNKLLMIQFQKEFILISQSKRSVFFLFFFFILNESNFYDSKFISKRRKTKNDLNFQSLPTAKWKEDVRVNKSFCCRPSFFLFFFSTVTASQFFFFFIIICFIYIFYSFMLLDRFLFLLNNNLALLKFFFFKFDWKRK